MGKNAADRTLTLEFQGVASRGKAWQGVADKGWIFDF
jgi:hypothetical protein